MMIGFPFWNKNFKAAVTDVAVLSFSCTLQACCEDTSVTLKRYLYLSYLEWKRKSARSISQTSSIFGVDSYRLLYIYLLTVIRLTLGGSSTVSIFTQTLQITTQLIWEEPRSFSFFASYTLAFAVLVRKSAEKPQSW